VSARPNPAAARVSPKGDHPIRFALRRKEAAAALGISDEVFDEHVRSELPVVRLASVKVYPIAGIEAWLAKATAPAEDVR
jgi:hypothetical protein